MEHTHFCFLLEHQSRLIAHRYNGRMQQRVLYVATAKNTDDRALAHCATTRPVLESCRLLQRESISSKVLEFREEKDTFSSSQLLLEKYFFAKYRYFRSYWLVTPVATQSRVRGRSFLRVFYGCMHSPKIRDYATSLAIETSTSRPTRREK